VKLQCHMGKSLCMRGTVQQMHLFNDEAYAPVPPPSFGLGRLLGLVVILATWALIAWMIWMLT